VVAPSALAYKDADMNVRVVHYQHGDLLAGGTRVEGQFENLIDLQENALASLTVAGRSIRNRPGVFAYLSTALADADINVDAVASGLDSITFSVYAEAAEAAETVLHEAVINDAALSSVTVDDAIAAIRVTGGELPTQSGVVRELVDPLADAHIPLHDVITSATAVAVFVAWDDREDALEIIQDAL
jgi:aspartate kinase